MKVSIEWLKDFTPITAGTKELCDALTLSGSKVEDHYTLGEDICSVITGRIISLTRHPDADKLSVCQVDIGKKTIQVVTGADNVHPEDRVPVAIDGARLPGGVLIHTSTFRGINSEGMLCSLPELGLTSADFPYAVENGIMILPDNTPAGHTIQEILGLNDTVLDFEITPNRVDCFSVEGIARETAITFEQPFQAVHPEVIAKHADESSAQASIRIEAPDLCYRYCGRVIRHVILRPSPDWMRRRLRAAGMRPINNIVDITNYVMLELGQPMHAFDLKQLAGNQILVRRAFRGEKMRTLDGADRNLDTDMLVIADRDRAVALAGVMGAENSEITSDTRTILLESATFNPVSVRQTAIRAGLRTEASSRFEKGLDVHNASRGMDRACQLIEKLEAGEVCQGMIDVWPVHPEPVQIIFRPDAVNRFLGTHIRPEWMINCLEKLDLQIHKTGSAYQAVIPSYRPDLASEADLSEEIARFYGYNQIKPSLLSGKQTTLGGRNQHQKTVEKIKDLMIGQGFYEACTYSFESPRKLDKLRVPPHHVLRKSIKIRNPLGEDYSCMRTSMLPSLLTVAATNFSHSVESAQIFEIGSVYLADELPLEDLPKEVRHLTAFCYQQDARPADGQSFFLMKGIVEEIMLHLGISSFCFQADSEIPWLHPGQTANVMLNSRVIGQIGVIHPDVAVNYSVPPHTAILDILIDPILDAATEKRLFAALPKYPAVSRDLALLVSADITADEIESAVRQGGAPYLEKIRLFDIYQGQQIPAGMKSFTYSLVFRAADRTLAEEDIQTLMQKILAQLKDSCGAVLREV